MKSVLFATHLYCYSYYALLELVLFTLQGERERSHQSATVSQLHTSNLILLILFHKIIILLSKLMTEY